MSRGLESGGDCEAEGFSGLAQQEAGGVGVARQIESVGSGGGQLATGFRVAGLRKH